MAGMGATTRIFGSGPGIPAQGAEPGGRALGPSGVVAPPSHPWDGYLTGPENELAMAAAQAMARGEDAGLSPMVVHGPSGVGKSRLLAGLVAERLLRAPGTSVAHLDAETFAASYAEAAGATGDGRPGAGGGGSGSGDGWSAMRGRLREVGLLILEDLEGLTRAPSARDELAHTLDALESAGASVAVSARTAPGTWPRREWPSRLLSRLQGGLTVRIDPPGLAVRRRYVLSRTGPQGLTLLADAVERLASAADGYRTLEGWLARLALEARIGYLHAGAIAKARALDAATVDAILAEETVLAGPTTSIDGIARSVAARFGVRLGLLRGPSRRASVVAARHLAMHLARTLTGSSFATIGAYFGDRDPATVRHACRAALERLAADPALAAVAAAIAADRVNGPSP
jgi:chromosomal replication initiator protein